MNGKITDRKPIFVAYVNTDLTEGRGAAVPMACSESRATVERLGRGKNVQGCNAVIESDVAIRLEGSFEWYMPGRLVNSNKEDDLTDERREAKDIAAQKAKELGLSEEDIAALSNGG